MLIIIIHILNHNAINFYKKYENHKYDESTEYIVASVLNGDIEPTHNWERFNSNQSTSYGGTILTPGGNRYK